MSSVARWSTKCERGQSEALTVAAIEEDIIANERSKGQST